MSKGIKIIILLLVGLLIIAGIFWLVFGSSLFQSHTRTLEGIFSGKPNGPLPESGEKQEPEKTPSASTNALVRIPETGPEPIDTEDVAASQVGTVAFAFVERFGSYSNENPQEFENIKDSQYYMTESMKAWSENFMQKEAEKQQTGSYTGVTTKALAVKSIAFDESGNRAELTVSTQRQQFQGSADSRKIIYQDIFLEMVKAGDSWKVDSAYWR